MEKIKLSLISLIGFLSCTIIYVACTKQKEYYNSEQIFLDEYQKGLNMFYVLVENKINCYTPKIDLTDAFKESYIEVYRENADLSVFNDSYKNYLTRSNKGSNYAQNMITGIVNNSLSELDAIIAFENLIKDEKVPFEDKVDFVSMKETLWFMYSTRDYLEANYITENSSKSEVEPCKGWWKCWGKCVASILGGSIAGGIAGCGILGGLGAAVGSATAPGPGTVIGGVAGCATGNLVGGIGGALTGAVLGCDND